MRIIAVWSLFARWPCGTTGAKGCSALAQKNTRWATAGKRGLEIFLSECQRIPRPGVFINSERINFERWLYSAWNIELAQPRSGDTERQTYWKCKSVKETEVQAIIQGVVPVGIFLWCNFCKKRSCNPRKERVCGCRRTWSVRNDRRQPHSCSRGPDKRIVAWRLKFLIRRRRQAHGLADWSLGREAMSPAHPHKALRQIGV